MPYGTDKPCDNSAHTGMTGPAGPRQAFSSSIAYLYDGSFEGLLCCVYESYYQRELPSMIFCDSEMQETLFPVKEIVTDNDSAQKVEHSISHSISNEALQLVRLCYYSRVENREIAILNFLRIGYKTGAPVTDMLANDAVMAITKIARNVSRESNYYREFLRFSDYNGALVAIIEPKNFVLPMIVEHYCDRFPGERFLIYDESHKYAIVYLNGESAIVPLENLELPKACAKEEKYRALWKRFYDTIAIEGRVNPKLRMNNMPKRYWKHLAEFRE